MLFGFSSSCLEPATLWLQNFTMLTFPHKAAKAMRLSAIRGGALKIPAIYIVRVRYYQLLATSTRRFGACGMQTSPDGSGWTLCASISAIPNKRPTRSTL